MKRITKISVAALSAVLLITGCSKSESVSPNADIIQATSAVKNYSGITDINFSALSEGKNISMGTTGEISLQNFPFFADINLNIYSEVDGEDPEITDSRMLLETKDSINTVYLFHNDEWQKETVESDKFRTAASQYDVIETVKLIMESSANMQKSDSDELNGVTVDRYEGTILKDMLTDFMKQTGMLSLIGTNIGKTYYKDCEDPSVKVWVNSEGVAIGYEMELTDVVQCLFKALYAENNITDESAIIQFDSYIAKGTVTSYDEGINSIVPDEAIAAVDIAKENTAN